MDEILAAMDADELRASPEQVSESVSDLSGYDEEESTALLALMIQYPIDEVTAFLEEELTSHQVDVGSAAPSGAWSAVPAVVAAPHWIAVPGEGDEFIDDYIAQFLNEEEAA